MELVETRNQAAMQQTQASAGNGRIGARAQAPNEYGIQSSLKELAAEVLDARILANGVHDTFGIASPEKGSGSPQNPGNPVVVEFIRDLTFSLRETNARTREALKHFNS